mmetsp:Transcript_9579/g.20883  ORF Transcript_9579/g.20883 Transcript_9579/m.20883 type:complete len:146 (-) Transcript_9579:12-449(-)
MVAVTEVCELLNLPVGCLPIGSQCACSSTRRIELAKGLEARQHALLADDSRDLLDFIALGLREGSSLLSEQLYLEDDPDGTLPAAFVRAFCGCLGKLASMRHVRVTTQNQMRAYPQLHSALQQFMQRFYTVCEQNSVRERNIPSH